MCWQFLTANRINKGGTLKIVQLYKSTVKIQILTQPDHYPDTADPALTRIPQLVIWQINNNCVVHQDLFNLIITCRGLAFRLASHLTSGVLTSSLTVKRLSDSRKITFVLLLDVQIEEFFFFFYIFTDLQAS